MDKRLEEKSQELWGVSKINPKYCKTCKFSKGAPPFADAPEKSYCIIFSRENGMQKPKSVYYDGAECSYYAKDAE